MRYLLLVGLMAAVTVTSADRAVAERAPQLRAGAATSNITPPLGGEIIGGFRPIPARHIHDELRARCLVLDDGETQLALVVCDLLGIHRSVSDEARRLISQHSGIPPEQVMISATHTHSACSALGGNRFAPDPSLDKYQRFVARRIADGVARAKNLLQPAELAFGTAEAPEHVFNRRWYMRPGTVPTNPFGRNDDRVKMNPPAGSQNLLRPAGPTDPTVSLVSVRSTDGSPLALFAAYSLHYVGGVGRGHVSADYFAMFCEEIVRLQEAERADPPMVPMMANGTSGDINNINFREPRERRAPYEQMRSVATDLARRVDAALEGLEYRRDITLEARYREPEIDFRRPDAELIAWAEETLAEPAENPRRTSLPRIYAERTLRMAEHPEAAPMPLQVLRIGEVAIATMPCEVFCEIGLEYRDRSALQPAFMVSLAHGYYGYLPTPRQHRLGGYETWLGTNRLKPAASDKMLEHLLEMTAELAE